jgi:serine/threonine protein kinase
MPALTVTRELSMMPAVAGAPTAGFRLNDSIELGPLLDTNDLGDRHPVVGPAAIATPTAVTLLRSSPVASARQALIIRLHTEMAKKVANVSGWATGGELRGIPSWIGLARDDHGTQWVAVSEVDLSVCGFHALDDVLTRYWADFWGLSVPRRLAFVHSFLRTVAALDDLQFIHGAIDASSILLHPQQERVALTNVGSGAFGGYGRSHVCSVGPASDFLAPELIDPAGPRPEFVGVTTDRWSVGVAIFYLLFGVHPLYFLPDLGRRTIEAYQRSNTWPAVPPAIIAAGSTPVEFAQAFGGTWAQLPAQVTYLMSELFESGWADQSRRPDVDAWVAAFGVPLSAPLFTRVSLGSSVVIEGGEVPLSWETTDAFEVEVVGVVGRFPPTGSARIPMYTSRHLELHARGPLGTATEITRRIDVVPLNPGRPGAAPASSSAPAGADDEIDADTELLEQGSGLPWLFSDMLFATPPGEASLFDPEPLGLPPPPPSGTPPTTSAHAATSTPPLVTHFRAPWTRNPGRRQPKARP